MRELHRRRVTADLLPALVVVATLVAATGVYYVVFGYRLDYPAHLLAGGSLVLLLLGLATAVRIRADLAVLAALATMLVVMTIGEATRFGGSFDAIDVANSVLGGLVVGAAVSAAPERRLPGLALAVAGVLGLVAGWYLRYHLRYGGDW